MNKHDPKEENLDTELDLESENLEPEIDDEIEFEDEVVAESSLGDKMKKLRAELKKAKEESREYLTGWQTERASFANYKAEEEKKRKERLSLMKTQLISDFFPVLDSFDMAFSNQEAWEKVDASWRSGIEYIHSQFMGTLQEYNISVVDQTGVAFDPMIHEPVEQVPVDDESQDDLVMKIIQKGYRAGDIVLRPAKVNVGTFGANKS